VKPRVVQLVSLLALLFHAGCASRHFYYPDQQVYETPAYPYEDVTFNSLDGTRLQARWIPARTKEPQGTVLHLHGNAANLTAHAGYIEWLPPRGYHVLMVDYRGYGASESKRPTRRGGYLDSAAALMWLRSRNDLTGGQPLYVLGQSLGGANALAILGRGYTEGVSAVVIDSTFYSYRSMVESALGTFPGGWPVKKLLALLVIGNGYSPGPRVAEISPVPIMFIHGTDDRTIPYAHGERLYVEAGEPKVLVTIPGGHHTDAFLRYGDLYRDQVIAFFEQYQAPPPQSRLR
jgi:uncharacterized protein